MLLLALIILLAAAFIFLAGQIILAIQPFRVHILLGLCGLFLPIVGIVVSILNWQKQKWARRGLVLYGIGLVGAFLGNAIITVVAPDFFSDFDRLQQKNEAIEQARYELLLREGSGNASRADIAAERARIDSSEAALTRELETLFEQIFSVSGADQKISSDQPFQDAIALGAQAANETQVAETKAEWAAIAQTWQQAIDLLLQVPMSDPNYVQAQTKVMTYMQNMEYAWSNAQ